MLKAIVKSISNIHVPSNELSNVVIISVPRSGSTWLMELIWSQSGFKHCNEPLNIRQPKIASALGLNHFFELYKPENQCLILRYFSSIHNGKHGFLNPSPFRKHYRFFTNRIVYKVINAGGHMVDAIAEATNSKVIYLIRHPFTVSLSRKVLPRLEVLSTDIMLEKMGINNRDIVDEVLLNGDYLDKAVLAWCLENKLALHNKSGDWIFCTYEQLVIDPKPIINVISDTFKLEKVDKIFAGLNIPSAVTVQSESGTSERIKSNERDKLISKWKEKIDRKKANTLWRIVEAFELDIYDKDTSMPNSYYTIT